MARGQTSIDMVFAIGVFAIGLSVAFGTAGGYFTGGVVDASDTTPTADTVATELVSEFTNGTTPGGQRLQAQTTTIVEFFTDGVAPAETVSVPDDIAVNVTLRVEERTNPPDVFDTVSGEADAKEIHDGPPPRIGAATATRTISIDGTLVTLEVRTWLDV